MKNKKCDCCQKELGQVSVKKYTLEICEACCVKVLDKLSLVESTFERAIKDIS